MSLTIVVPAYNESKRILPFLAELRNFINANRDLEIKVTIVNDGSTDNSLEIVNDFIRDDIHFAVLSYEKNRGKGAAVQYGVKDADSDFIIFMDADGATRPTEIPKMLQNLKNADIAIGNRWLAESKVEKRTFLRQLSSWVYRNYMRLFSLGGIDTMCGFKGFRKDVAKKLFANLFDERWLFDTEICYKAKRMKYKIVNFPINWESKQGSKLKSSTIIKSFFAIPILIWQVKKQTEILKIQNLKSEARNKF